MADGGRRGDRVTNLHGVSGRKDQQAHRCTGVVLALPQCRIGGAMAAVRTLQGCVGADTRRHERGQ